MKVNMDLVRALLIQAETRSIAPPPGLTNSEDLIGHKRELERRGLARVTWISGNDNPYHDGAVTGLTQDGERLLEAIRDDAVWQEIRRRLGDGVSSVSPETVIGLASAIGRNRA